MLVSQPRMDSSSLGGSGVAVGLAVGVNVGAGVGVMVAVAIAGGLVAITSVWLGVTGMRVDPGRGTSIPQETSRQASTKTRQSFGMFFFRNPGEPAAFTE